MHNLRHFLRRRSLTFISLEFAGTEHVEYGDLNGGTSINRNDSVSCKCSWTVSISGPAIPPESS